MLRRILTKWGMSTTAAAILASCVLKTQGTCDELLTCPPEGSGGQAGTGGNSTGGAAAHLKAELRQSVRAAPKALEWAAKAE